MNKFDGLYNVRDFRPGDRNFILATFLEGLYYGDSWFSLIDKESFFFHYGKVAEHLVNSPNVAIKVACLPDDPDAIIGYSMLSSDFLTIHWTHIKKRWRGHGVMRSLLPQYPATITHLNSLGLKLKQKLYPTTIFNPFDLP